VLITDVSLVAAVWTLTGRRYGLGRGAICRLLRSLVGDACFDFESRQVVWASLRDYEDFVASGDKELDFADALIVNKARYPGDIRGAATTLVYSFDKALVQLDGTCAP
jgi:predicted nucleic-acid-binding protein